MAIIYTYPDAAPAGGDKILGTQFDNATEENKTVQFAVDAVANLATNNYLETTVIVTNSQLTALQTTDVELIAAPGANKYIRVLAASAFLDYTAPVFTFAGTLNAKIGANTQFNISSAFAQSAADTVCGINVSSSGTEFTIPVNSALILDTAGAVGGGGGSSMQIKIRYQILDTSTTSSF